GAPRPFPTPGYPWVPILFTLAGVGIVINLFFTETRDALLCSAILAAGVPVYLLWSAADRRRAVRSAAAAAVTVAGRPTAAPGAAAASEEPPA
ncbi:MAG TPA: hypothetical protein VKY89_09290, partial [Thermoanaerobaculia bacterium]|nr:hypothetical protein [Thermoanaerobaculia bacterium]